MDLTLLVVNWNSADLLASCLGSVETYLQGVSYEAIIVDNRSEEGDRACLEQLEARFPWASFIYNQDNLGFARANNQALKLAQGKYILLLNPDTCFVQNGLNELLAVVDRQEVGLVSCRLLNEDKTTQTSCFYFPLPGRAALTSLLLHKLLPAKFKLVYTAGDHERAQTPDWVLGAFMLMRREVLLRVGGFDESIFMYGEDMDLCYRIRQLGLEIVYEPSFTLVHHGGHSGRQAWSEARKEIMVYQAIFYFYHKHLGPGKLLAARLFYALGALLRLAGHALGALSPGRLEQSQNEIRTQWAVFLTQFRSAAHQADRKD